MPTYEYKCPDCGFKTDYLHAVDRELDFYCNECQNKLVKGFGGGTGIHFKGSGFYETDYKGK